MAKKKTGMSKAVPPVAMPPGWGQAPTTGGFGLPVTRKPAAPRADDQVRLSEKWATRVDYNLNEFIRIEVGDPSGDRIAIGSLMRGFLHEYAEAQVKLDLRCLLQVALQTGGAMGLTRREKTHWVGVVARLAVEVMPHRSRGSNPKTPPTLEKFAAGSVRANLFDESGKQTGTLTAAVNKTHARLAELVTPDLMPEKKTVREWFGKEQRERGPGGPKPRQGRPPKK